MMDRHPPCRFCQMCAPSPEPQSSIIMMYIASMPRWFTPNCARGRGCAEPPEERYKHKTAQKHKSRTWLPSACSIVTVYCAFALPAQETSMTNQNRGRDTSNTLLVFVVVLACAAERE